MNAKDIVNHLLEMESKAVVFSENPNSKTGEVMPGMYFLTSDGQWTKDKSKAKRWSPEKAEEFASMRTGFDWMLED